MTDQSETLQPEKLPIWIPDKVQGVLRKVLSKEPIDLTSPEVIGKHFVNQAEVQDIYDIISQVKEPILIGINGSRASLSRTPLFENVAAFESYHGQKARLEGSLQEYLFQKGLTMEDYQLARRCLQDLGFNEGYKQGRKYPPAVVSLLVSDIDLIIIANGTHILGGPHMGARTNVPIDISAHSPYYMFETDPRELERYYLKPWLAVAIPLKYR